jgi:MSHA biogenesis protein MshO
MPNQMSSCAGLKQKGFTLIELVAVIVIVGVLAIASVQFIAFGTQIYVEANDRQLTLSKSRFAIERMTREIRGAIPNSVRISSSKRCIEFTPIKASGAYRDDSEAVAAPISPDSGTEMEVVGWLGDYDVGDRVYIYPTSSDDIYSSTTKVGFLDVNASGTAPELTLTFDADMSFEEHSPKRRYYTADESISYCFISNGTGTVLEPNYDLYRFTSASFAETQSEPISATGIILMAEGLTNNLNDDATQPFDIYGSTLNRNAVVNLYLEFNANLDENMFFNHEVHIPNVP